MTNFQCVVCGVKEEGATDRERKEKRLSAKTNMEILKSTNLDKRAHTRK